MTPDAAAGPVFFRLPMPVRWRDMDAFGHVNNASYLGYVEEARVQWFRSLGPDWDGAAAAPIMAAVQMNYRRPSPGRATGTTARAPPRRSRGSWRC